MNSYFTVKVKYTRQNDDGTFKRVSEPYLLAAMTFTDAEARIYEELGDLIRGEFLVTGISRTDIHDIFHYEDSDTWFKCKIKFENGEYEEGKKSKKVTQIFLVSAHSVKEAYERLQESLGGMLIDFGIPNISESPIVDIFPFGDKSEDDDWIPFKERFSEPPQGTLVDIKVNGNLNENYEYEGEGVFLGEEDKYFHSSDGVTHWRIR